MKTIAMGLMVILMSSLVMAIPTPQEEPLVKGDLNSDLVLDCADMEIYQNILTNGGYKKMADINGDGVVNFQDTFWYLKEIGDCRIINPTEEYIPTAGGYHWKDDCFGEIEVVGKYKDCRVWEAEHKQEWSWLKWKMIDSFWLHTEHHKVFMKEGEIRVFPDDMMRFKLTHLSEEKAILEVTDLKNKGYF